MNKKLLIILGIVLLIVIAWYFLFWRRAGTVPVETPQKTPEARGPVFKIDLSFLDTELVKSLEQYGRFPIRKGRPGRSNPFLPY